MKIYGKLTKALLAVFVLALTSVLGIGLLSLPSTSQPAKTVNASNEHVVYDGAVDGDGQGTPESPYFVGSYATLNSATCRNYLAAGKTVVLISDIDMGSANWNPIPTCHANSVFDGNNYTLTNFKTALTGGRGLFNNLLGTVKNLVFENVSFGAYDPSGIIAANVSVNSASTNVNALIDNVRIESGTVTTTGAAYYIGSFIGRISGTGPTTGFSVTIQNCYENLTFNGYRYSGGAIGHYSASYGNINIINYSREGSSTVTSDSLGGVIGYLAGSYSTFNLENCYNYANLTGTSYVGGLIGYIGSTETTINIDSCYNKGNISSNSNYVGGFIGYISSATTEINISNSYSEGNINCINYAGGLIGAVAGNTSNINIEACYAIGNFTITGSNLGGILGFFNSTTTEVDIKNCFVDVSLQSVNYQGGIFGSGNNASYASKVEIYNSYICTDNTFNLYTSENVPCFSRFATLMDGLTDADARKTRDQMKTVEFINLINNNTDSFALSDDYEIKLRTFYGVKFTLDPNGGVFTDGETNLKTLVYGLDSLEIESPKRIGYNFLGWTSEIDGSDEPYATVENIPTTHSATYYAKWELTEYLVTGSYVQIDDEKDDSATIEAKDASNNLPIDYITLNQKGYLHAHLVSATGHSFVTWQVQNKEKNWENLGYGSKESGGAATGLQRFNLTDGSSYIINEEFIEKYAQDGEIVFKALYTNDAVETITIINGPYGVVQVDGANILFNQQGEAEHSYSVRHNENMTITVIPNNYRELAKIEIDDGSGWNDISDNGTKTTVIVENSDSINLHGLQIRVTYKLKEYAVEVVAETRSGELISDSFGLINNPSNPVVLNDEFNTASVLLYTDGYRLVSDKIRNIKILNKLTGKYDYYSAIDGAIDLEMTESFFDKYLDIKEDGSGSVTVIAEYVKQFRLDVDIFSNESSGSIDIKVNSPSGRPSMNPNFYDEGSIVTISIFPGSTSKIADIDGIDEESELNYAGNKITFALIETRAITITFGTVQFTLNALAIDSKGGSIDDEISVTIIGATNLVDGDQIHISKGESNDYRFLGWFAKVGNEFKPVFDVDTDLDIAAELEWADGSQINIFAMFEKQFAATIEYNSGGTVSAKILVNGVPTTNVPNLVNVFFDEDAVVRISFEFENEYIYLKSVDGLDQAEVINNAEKYVDITIDSVRYLSFNFAPKPFTVTTNNNNASGKIEVHAQEIALNDKVVITFNVDSGYEIAKWKLNGMTVSQINAEYAGADAKQNGNTITFTVTAAWLNDHNGTLDNTVKTQFDSTYLMIIVVAGVLVLLLLAGILFMLNANKKRKEAYAKAVRIRDERTKGLNIGNMVSQLRSEENK